jgi:hypothetical protein
MGNKVTAVLSHRRKRVVDSVTRPANTTQYTAGDVISSVTTNDHFVFQRVVDEHAHTGTIESAIIHSSAASGTPLDGELWLFHTDVAEVADHAAFAPTDAEMLTLVGVIDFATADWKLGIPTTGTAGNATLPVTGLNIPFVVAAPDDTTGKTLYGQLVARNTYTPIASEVITIELMVAQD